MAMKNLNLFRNSAGFLKSLNKIDNTLSVAYLLIRWFKIKITLPSVIQYLKPHPDYPSLKSVCDLFDYFNVKNYPVRIDEEDLYNLSEPFIAHLNSGQGKLIIVYRVDPNKVLYSDSLNGRKSFTKDEFIKNWSGAAILIDPSADSGESDFKEKSSILEVKSSIIPVIISLFFFILICGIFFTGNFKPGIINSLLPILILTKSVGLFFAILLLIHELEFKTKFTEKLCHISTNADCNAVTKSRASRIFGNVTWADAGVSYFISGLILLFLNRPSDVNYLLAVLAVLSLLYSVFSVLYQLIKLKKWCPLCISVQTILILEFVFLFNYVKIAGLTPDMILQAIIILLVVFILVLLIKMLYLSEQEKEFAMLELLKLKRKPEVFLSQLRLNDRINISETKYSLIFGKKESDLTIIVFLSLHCSACSKKFKEVLNLLNTGMNVRVHLIFSPGKDGAAIKLAKLILKNIKYGEDNKILTTLRMWYDSDNKYKQDFLKNIEGTGNETDFENFIKFNGIQFIEHKIMGVPSVFINGYPFPESYTLDDIFFHLDSIRQLGSIYEENKVLT